MSGFDGHVKLSILNSPNNPELPDWTVGARAESADRDMSHYEYRSVIFFYKSREVLGATVPFVLLSCISILRIHNPAIQI